MTKAYAPARLITRPVAFDWADLPFYWIKGEPFASHAFNMTHCLLPAGEKWFCRVFQEGMEQVTDPALKRDMMLFVKQEANHARAHNEVVDYYAAHGIDCAPVVDHTEAFWHEKLGPKFRRRELKSRWARRQWFMYRLGVVAAIEHFTCVFGKWMLETPGFDEAECDPRMVDLLRWHGAEEIEHRAVAHNLLVHLGGGSWPGRLLHILSAMVIMTNHMVFSAKYVFAQDTEFQMKPLKEELRHARAKNLLPRTSIILKAVGRFLKPGYHPDHEASLDDADAYLVRSQAVAAASK